MVFSRIKNKPNRLWVHYYQKNHAKISSPKRPIPDGEERESSALAICTWDAKNLMLS